jgi:D-sedoheptulose 7-phosphate isomerase
MGMLEQRIQQQFFDSADLQYQAAEGLARPLADAAQALVGCLTAGGKLLIAGSGAGAPLAALLGASLAGCFERERPPLAAIVLRADGAIGLGPAGGPEAVLARQVQALGQPGDLLLLLDTDAADAALRPVVQAAHEAEVNVVALAGQGSAGLRAALGETDVLVVVPHARRARVAELQLLALHCLCDAIDLQLMGEQEPT